MGIGTIVMLGGATCLSYYAGKSKVKSLMNKIIKEHEDKCQDLVQRNDSLKTEINLLQNENEILKRKIALGQNDRMEQNECSAKEAFVANIEKFKPLLESLSDGSYNFEVWTDIVLGINNADLLDDWKQVCKSEEIILRLLGSWGINADKCKSFVCTETDRNRYENENGETLMIGKTYNVLMPVWIYSHEDENDRNIKEVILKGKVSNA